MRLSEQLRRLLPVVTICLTALSLEISGYLKPLNLSIAETRMSVSPREASGDVVFIALDARSLDAVGQWPWPRGVHAKLLDRLTDAGASDVFFDIDFAFASDPEEDAALEEALTRAGGATFLAVFGQRARAGQGGGAAEIQYNLPYAPFGAQGWPVLVNAWADRDGLVRTYPFGGLVEGEDIPSAASMLSGAFGEAGTRFMVNYSFRPETVPTYSASDVIAGEIPRELFAGRTVIVGAQAAELRDNFAVPVHSIIPGPMIHVLATETLNAGVALRWLGHLPVMGLLALMLVLLRVRRILENTPVFIATSILCLLAVEAVALIVFRAEAIVVPTGLLYPALIAHGLWRLAKLLDLSKLMLWKGQIEIENTRHLLEQVFNDSSDAIVVIDETGEIVASNDNARGQFNTDGEGNADVPGRMREAALTAIAAFRRETWMAVPPDEITIDRSGAARVLQYAVTPSTLKVAQSQSSRREADCFIATISARDVTELREKEARVDFLSKHDERTGALRRFEFLSRLEAKMRPNGYVTVFALNLHRFKTVNMTLGREIGDRLLVRVVDRIANAAPGLSGVARIDGDSFAVFSTAADTPCAAAAIAERIGAAVSAPNDLGDAHVMVEARIGYRLAGGSERLSPAQILDQAEGALDAARQYGGPRIEVYDPSLAEGTARSRVIERAMWGAVERGEFHMVYQPQVRLSDGALIGAEALVRWTHPELGYVYPDQFIGIAESNGYIRDLGRWVLKQSCEDAMLLPPELRMAVNVSAIQMLTADIIADVQAALRESGLAPERLWLELTESVFLTPNSDMIEAMRDLEMLGVSWALDDFGTGFSSLGYLSTLPLRKLKLDKQFTQGALESSTSLAILRSVSELCRGTDIELLCEGVETEEQADLLREEGCAEAQGYLYGKPVSLAELIEQFDLAPGRRAG